MTVAQRDRQIRSQYIHLKHMGINMVFTLGPHNSVIKSLVFFCFREKFQVYI